MRLLSAALVLFAFLAAPAGAQTPAAAPSPAPSTAAPASATPSPAPGALDDLARSRVDTMLRTGHAEAAWFSDAFLSQVPISKVDDIIAQFNTILGTYQSIDGTHGDYTAHFQKGSDEVLVHLDSANLIDAMLFRPAKFQTSSLDDGLSALRASGGTLSYVLIEGRSDRAALNASEPLAVGSAFKLAVLAALRDRIERGRMRWTDVVPLAAAWKSLPSGVIGTWPDGTPLTIATYATQMISISDNTAADALVDLAGPAWLAPYAMGNVPFLTTRQAFTLKSDEGTGLRAAYLAAGTAAKRAAVLRSVDKLPLPATNSLAVAPTLGVEWHYSVRELCALIHRVAGLPLMSINPGVADGTSFRHVAFKGGSDTGVINLTTEVTTKRGTTFCFSATLNDASKAVDEERFTTAYSAVIGALANR
ncbi:MAG: serine hydrolase [Vulcanimicrobiaceae bacterium]